MRTISAALKTAQEASSGTPYVKLKFTSSDGGTTRDYSDRVLLLEHHEAPLSLLALNDNWAEVILANDDLAVADVIGYWVQIGYGFHTGNNVAEPGGDNAGNEYSYTSRLWVKTQQPYSAEGKLFHIIRLEGMWNVLAEQFLLLVGDPPLYVGEYTATTVYAIITDILSKVSTQSGVTFTLSALGTQDDGIINTFTPDFLVNTPDVESSADLITTLMAMTKCYLRAKSGLAFEVVFPQASDSDNETYYSDQAHYFYEYTEMISVLVPNRVIVVANEGGNDWLDAVVAEISDDAEAAKYMTVPQVYWARNITTYADALNRADAILTKLKADIQAGRAIIPHDCSVELYDKVKIYDTRGL